MSVANECEMVEMKDGMETGLEVEAEAEFYSKVTSCSMGNCRKGCYLLNKEWTSVFDLLG